MAPRFPLYIDLKGNNCTIFGGGEAAASRAEVLLKFNAKITVISPTLCDRLREMDEEGLIRYIPRKYFRGDCSSAYLCIAATDDVSMNIAISEECKAKSIPVNVTRPYEYGTFDFPAFCIEDDVTVSVSCVKNPEFADEICSLISEELPELLQATRRNRNKT
ncbi:MAG TPA: bifunctional precorrin-2 dehydrogenase/sirohydrochlorin ferrochelatase [Clostridiales bacterium]|nr:bifunctional precorrin-2 dehydrogenase/sirohydrochlorin ferrochelatase [Clostridiales bacterium]